MVCSPDTTNPVTRKVTDHGCGLGTGAGAAPAEGSSPLSPDSDGNVTSAVSNGSDPALWTRREGAMAGVKVRRPLTRF